MSPRADAWLRQARSDLDAARCMVACITPPYRYSLESFLGMLQTQGLNTQNLNVLQLKPLTSMNRDIRYLQGDEAPADFFAGNESQASLTIRLTSPGPVFFLQDR